MLTDERDPPAKIPVIFVLQIRIDQTDNHTWYISPDRLIYSPVRAADDPATAQVRGRRVSEGNSLVRVYGVFPHPVAYETLNKKTKKTTAYAGAPTGAG